jgi:predicted nucleic acid-binding protein
MDPNPCISVDRPRLAAGADAYDRGSRNGAVVAERYGLSVFDAMIAASALHADCDTLWSEDLQDGVVLEGRLCVINPFRAP